MLQFARREPSAILLAMQLAGVLLYPFMEGSGRPRAVQRVRDRGPRARRARGPLHAGADLGRAPARRAGDGAAADPGGHRRSDELLPYSSAFEAVLYFYAAGALIPYMLADHVITRDELWAVGATFTLVAWAFAYTYTVVQAI